MNGIAKKLSIAAFILTVGAAGLAFAHGGFGGYGYGGHMMGPGYGSHMMGYGHHMGWGWDREGSGLTQEQADRLEAARESFYRETRDLRNQIYDRSAQIRQEFSKEPPDRNRIQDLQKEISKLESELDQKRLDYQLKTRDIAPESEGGFAGRGNYGPGAGYCWR
jgi:Spy/CpxP family protein refolding chaperone